MTNLWPQENVLRVLWAKWLKIGISPTIFSRNIPYLIFFLENLSKLLGPHTMLQTEKEADRHDVHFKPSLWFCKQCPEWLRYIIYMSNVDLKLLSETFSSAERWLSDPLQRDYAYSCRFACSVKERQGQWRVIRHNTRIYIISASHVWYTLLFFVTRRVVFQHACTATWKLKAALRFSWSTCAPLVTNRVLYCNNVSQLWCTWSLTLPM